MLLRKIHSFFGVGVISEREGLNIVVYSVQSYIDIFTVIIPHFDKYPLITQKKADYLLFKQGVDLLKSKVQKNIEGIHQIISLKSSMNNGLSDTLRMQFLTVPTAPRPVIRFEGIPHPNWLAGFVDGDGCFYVNTRKSNVYSSGYQIIISLSISQHVRDELLFTKFIDYLECGRIEIVSNRQEVRFIVSKFRDIQDKIIPFFQKYPLHGIKSMDYRDFCEIAKIMESKSHLTPEGVHRNKISKVRYEHR